MAASSPSPGDFLGHFRLIEQIGAGGMGIVYRARDTRLERDVAVKVLNAKTLNSDSARQRFRREALTLSRLNHPNVEAVYDFHSEQGIDYLVMEYVPGVSLDKRLEQGPLPEKELMAVGIQLARGLAAAHAQRILHRDLKPANLKMTPERVLKILDFGLAQLLTLPEDETLTQTEAVHHPAAGTPPYLSPEQIVGKDPDHRSDIYSAGVVLYELATGSRPFSDRGEMLRWAILHTTPPAPRTKNPNITPDLESTIVKCLQKDPDQRYQSANDLLEELKEQARGSGPHRAVAVPPRSGWRSKRWLPVTIIVSMLVLAAAGVVLWRKFKAQTLPSRVSVLVTEFENRTEDPVFDQTPRELISAALGQSPQVSVFPSSRVLEVLRRMQKPETLVVDEKVGSEICTREGLQSVVSGSVTKLGSSYLVLVRVLNCNGDLIISTEKGFSGPEQLPPTMDEIAATIRRKWGESKAAIRQASQPLASVTSRSLEAVKLYSLGKRQLYLGDVRGALSFFTRAVELDDDFAMAHEYLAITYERLGDDDRARKEYSRAAELAGRVTEREREKTLGDYLLFKGDFEGAISHYRVLSMLSPEDPAVHLNLALCYERQFRFDWAIEETKKAVELLPAPSPKVNLAIDYFLSGDSQRAMDLAHEALQEYPDNPKALYLIGSYYLAAGQLSDADRIWRQLLAMGDASRARSAMADEALVLDDPKEAITQLQYGLIASSNLQNSDEFLRKKILLGDIYWALSDYQSLRRSIQNLPQPEAPELIFLLGRLYARAGLIEDAQKQLHRLGQLPDKTPALESFANLLQSEIAAVQGLLLDAVQSAKVAVQYLNAPLAIETLARTYQLAGDRENAARQYEIMLARSNERQFASLDSPALHAVVHAHYRLGVLYQTLGKNDLAKAQFSSFLNYAAEEEQTGPLYEDARNRMKELKGTSSGPANQPPPHKESIR